MDVARIRVKFSSVSAKLARIEQAHSLPPEAARRAEWAWAYWSAKLRSDAPSRRHKPCPRPLIVQIVSTRGEPPALTRLFYLEELPETVPQ